MRVLRSKIRFDVRRDAYQDSCLQEPSPHKGRDWVHLNRNKALRVVPPTNQKQNQALLSETHLRKQMKHIKTTASSRDFLKSVQKTHSHLPICLEQGSKEVSSIISHNKQEISVF